MSNPYRDTLVGKSNNSEILKIYLPDVEDEKSIEYIKVEGEKRFVDELIKDYGFDSIEEYIDEVINFSDMKVKFPK